MAAPHILVVEDHRPLREIICDTLSEEGFRVTTAEDGQAALQLMERQRPDLIVADIMMPQMDGYEFYSAVQGTPEWISIPFIFLTAKAEREDILRGKTLGAEDYLTKPFDPETLIVTVKARLQRAQAIQSSLQLDFEQLKEKIIVLLSHELRTPLTYVRGYTELALEDAPELTPEQTVDFLSSIKRGVDRLGTLIEDLLLLVELDSGIKYLECQHNLEECENIGLVIGSLIDAHQGYAAQHKVRLEAHIPEGLPPVRLCQDFLVQALSRLIENGIKFRAKRQEDSRVVITVSYDEEWIDIEIADNGVGIPAEELPRLFRSFYQVDRQRMEQQGAGLGLAIAAGLIRLQGGKISVSSTPGKGSTFTVKLPLNRE